MGAAKGNQNAKGHHFGRPRKWSDEQIVIEADHLIEWAQKDEAIVLGTCYGNRGYSSETSSRWALQNEIYAHAKELAKTIIGSRREVMALKGRLDAGMVRASMATYDPEYRAFLKEMKRDQIIEDLTHEQAAKEISAYIKTRPTVKK